MRFWGEESTVLSLSFTRQYLPHCLVYRSDPTETGIFNLDLREAILSKP